MSNAPETNKSYIPEGRLVSSMNGVPYEYGVRISESDQGPTGQSTTSAATSEAEAGAQFHAIDFGPALDDNGWIKVHWTVGDEKWIDTDGRGSLNRYMLYYNGWPNIYDYTLEFTNTGKTSFYFKDESGDVYQVTTWLNRDHYVKYNSPKPTIVAFKSD